MNKLYIEVNMSDSNKKRKEPKDESMLMIAERMPTIKEAERFLARDIIHTYKCTHIVDLHEISKEYAESFYDLENEEQIPVFK